MLYLVLKTPITSLHFILYTDASEVELGESSILYLSHKLNRAERNLEISHLERSLGHQVGHRKLLVLPPQPTVHCDYRPRPFVMVTQHEGQHPLIQALIPDPAALLLYHKVLKRMPPC